MNAKSLIHVINVWATRFSPTPWQIADMYVAAAGAIRSVVAHDEDLAREAWHAMIVVGGDNFTLTACNNDANLPALLKDYEPVPAPAPDPDPVLRGNTQADRTAARKAAAAAKVDAAAKADAS